MRSELWLNDQPVDLTDELSAPITYQVADIRTPQSRNGSYSKTVKLPSTKRIDTLLSGIFDIAYNTTTTGTTNFVPDFNPNLKCSAVLYIDGLEQFRGYMKLNNIVRDQTELGRIYYEVTLFGESANIWGALGDAKLTDLTWSDLDHSYIKQVQKATWTNTNYGTGYVYPMINYGGAGPSSWDVNNFFPAVYHREILSRIFSYAGYSWNSKFLDSAYYKRLISPFTGDRFTFSSTEAANRLFSATNSATVSGTATIPGSSTYNLIFNTESTDPYNQYNTGTGVFTAAYTGYYEFGVSGTAVFDAITTCVFDNADCNIIVRARVQRVSSQVQYFPIHTSYAHLGTFSPVTYTSGQTIVSSTFFSWTAPMQLYAGDQVNIELVNGNNNSGATTSGTIGKRLNSGGLFKSRITNTQVLDGGTATMSTALPLDVKCSDYLSDTLKLFNLYVQPDKTNPTKLIIDTYDDFYASGTTRDWSKKLDTSRQVEIRPMGALNARRYVFKWTDDNDKWNALYKSTWQETFGQKNVDVTNDFLKNTETLQVLFAGTPSIGNNTNDRIIPEIYKESNTAVQSPINSKMRMIYWGGAKNTIQQWNYTSAVSGTSVEGTYPYAGHTDDPINPTVDVNLGVPREIYYVNPYGATVYTDDNIYNHYHKRYYNEITDPNSKIMTAYFRLRPIDIFNLSFRDKIFIDGHYWRINKVIDYDAIAETVTKVELILLKNHGAFSRTTHTLTWTNGDAISAVDFAPRPPVIPVTDGAVDNVKGGDVTTYSTARGTLNTGGSNVIGDNCRNVTVTASSGVSIMGGLSNVSVIASNNVTVTESNVTYLNGVRYPASATIFTLTSATTPTQVGTYLCNGTFTVLLDYKAFSPNSVMIIKNVGTGVITVNGAGFNIDGAATYDLTLTNESISILFTGSAYYIV